MSKGSQVQKCPANTIDNAVHIARIATKETTLMQPAKRNSGLAGMPARMQNTTPEGRKAIAQKAEEARWG